MFKYVFFVVFFCSTNIAFSQAQLPQKFYYIQHFSPVGLNLISCNKDIATHYSNLDAELVSNDFITYYYMSGKKYMVEYYEKKEIQSRKTYHYNGKKCFVEKRTMEATGSAGSAYGHNVQLYQFPFKMISAWDTSGIKTLKDGEGILNMYDSNGKLKRVNSFKNQGIYTNEYKSMGYYNNGKIMFEKNLGLLNYVLDEKGDTIIKNGTGNFVSKYSNDSLYANTYWGNGLLRQNIQYFFPNGQAQNDIFSDDKFTFYYDNGQVRISGEWDKGNKFGEWKWFDRKGKLLEQKTFEKFDLFRDARF